MTTRRPGRVSMFDMSSFFGLPPAKRQKKETKKKKTANNWFEECTVDQLKQLCKAATLPVSGTKPQLVNRLLINDNTSQYVDESAAYLKDQCRKKGLKVGGKKIDFVLRLLQDQFSAQTGIEPPRAQGTFDPETGKFQPKQRAKSMKLPDPTKLSERMQKKAYPPNEVKYKWSNCTSKYHCSRCVKLTLELMQKEIIDKELFERGQAKLAWQVVKELIRWWIYPQGDTSGPTNFREHVRGTGRCDFELKHDLYPKLVQFLEKTTPEDRKLLEEWGIRKLLWDLHKHARNYCVDDPTFQEALNKYTPNKKTETIIAS
jgi:hypothetical protein